MTREEVKKILTVMAISYSNFNVKDKSLTIDTWYMFLKDFDYGTVETALKMYIATSGSAFAPSISELIAMIRKPAELTQMEEVEAWRLVRNAIRRSNYYSVEEFEKFPPEVQAAVGEPSQLRDWALLESHEIDTVIHSYFKKRFETMQKRRQEINSMPVEVRALIEEKGAKRLNG